MKPLFVFCSSIAIFKLFSLRRPYKIINIWSRLISYISWNKSTIAPVLSPNEQFISIRSKRFLDSFDYNSTNSFNDNIDS